MIVIISDDSTVQNITYFFADAVGNIKAADFNLRDSCICIDGIKS